MQRSIRIPKQETKLQVTVMKICFLELESDVLMLHFLLEQNKKKSEKKLRLPICEVQT